MSRHGAWSVWSVVILFWPAAMALFPPTWDNVAAGGTTTASVSEDATADTSVFTLSATDPDGDALTYSLVTTSSEFKLDGQELQVLAGAVLDFESATTSYVLAVRVIAGGDQIDETLTVQVTGVNDNDPTWGTWIPGTMPATPSITIREDTSIGTVLFTAKANDADVGTGSTIIYTLDSVVDNSAAVATGVFNIDPVNGEVSTLQTLDRDSGITSYSLTVKANDGGSSPITQVVTVTLDDVNDVVPVFSPATYSVSMAETAAVTSASLVQVTATDTDESPTLTYSLGSVLVGNPLAKFQMSGTTAGLLELASDIDLDTGDAAYTVLEVLVTDSNTAPINTATTTVTITITPSNEHEPVFGATVPATNPIPLSESVAVGTSVATVPATDADAGSDGTVTYSITGGNTGNAFTIIPTTGEIRTLTELNFESTQSYILQVTATDGGTPAAKTAVTTVSVSVTNENDNTPTCTQYYIAVTLAEDEVVTYPVASLSCSDADTGATLTYTITSGNGDGKFAIIDPNTGAITLAQTVDYDSATQSYELQAEVSDGTNTQTVTVKITVTGVNDNNPTWGTWIPGTWPTTPSTVREDTSIGTVLFTAKANDADVGTGSTITYSLDQVLDNNAAVATGVFNIDPVNGAVYTRQTLDRDSGITSYSLTVKANDGGSSPITQVVTVTLDDVNDVVPVFSPATYSVSMAETAAVTSASLVQVTATDTDESPTLTYSLGSVLVGNPLAKFQMSGTTAGLLELASDIDLDTSDAAYTVLEVLVTDSNTAPINTATTTVTITITPSNEHDPVFGATVPATNPIPLSESVAVGTSVATVPATDADAGSDGTVTYSITGGNTGNAFTIIPTTGEIRTLTELNFESTQSYILQVTATDGGTPAAKTAVTTVSVSVTNENDNTPTCTQYYIAVTLAEDEVVTYPVASLGCSDADTGATLTYTITSGNGDGKFAITDPNTGAITLAQTVDYDSVTQSYELQVEVSDGTNTQTVTVKVTVTPVNEATPSFASNPTATPVSEDKEAGYLVHTYTATDSDYAPHGITSYAITAVTNGGGGKFTIDQSSGAIRLLTPLEYDALPAGNQVYELTVTATDGGGLVGTGTVTVAVQDVNDNAPTCTQSSWSVTVLENVATFPHTVIASLGCTDTEDGTTLTYALTQTPGSLFSEAGGAILLGSAVDYETSPSHIITVVVTDAGTTPQALSTTVVVNVNVQNVNDGPPTFTGTFDVTLQEDIAIGTSVADVSASDPDGATNAFGNPQHSIINGDPSAQFSIDSSTGRVTTRAALDADTTQVHKLTIKATEQGGGANSATVTLTVTVTDLNDHTPSCNVNTFALPVAEPSAANTAILTLTCTDGDVTPTTLTYTVLSGDSTKFEMNSNVLEVKALLDYDGGTTQYPLTIRVSDGTNNLDILGSVTVTAVNEAPPVFSPATYPVSKSESLAVGNTVVQVTATDSDSNNTPDGVIIYAFDVSSPQTKFTINSATGAIVLSSSLDREAGASSYSILVTASDGTNTVTATVTLTVTDENDNAPTFSAATYTSQVSESAAAGAAVVTVTATDADDTATNNNGVVSYAITGGDPSNHFTIVSTTGAITTSTQLDADVVNSYSLTVTATDRGGAAGALTSTAVVIVTVTSVNQYDPVFTQTTYTASTDESAPVGTTLVQVAASDADTGNDGTVTYSMTPHAKFSLAADGWIAVKAALDFETTPNSHTFNVVATDGGSPPKAATATVTITVGDVNDNTAMCTPSTITVQKREDATGAVTSLSCTDADSGTNANLDYTVQSVNGVVGAGNFAVATDGAVTVSALDYETASSLAVVISVADQGTTPRTTSVYLTVTVTDVNEYAPAFSVTPLAANVAEDKTVGDTVITVTATDIDGSDIITYSLDDTTKLQVDPASGVVTLKTPFDFETTPTYTVNVLAADSNTVDATKTSTVPLTLTITDVNDNSPVFNPSVYAASVDENKANGVTVTTVTASDADTADTIAYSIVNGNTNNVFRVDGGAGHIIVDDNSFLDYETNPTFTLTVRAEDGRGKSADVVVNIGVNPLNENTPTFTTASFTQSLIENLPASPSFFTVAATDADGGSDGAVTYSIASGASGKFAVNPSSGAISLVGGLDRETTQQHVIQIIAVDGGVNPAAKTGTYTLTIDVTDVNDVMPSCSATFYTASIPEDATVSASVKDITGCVDNDMDPANLNNALTYIIATGDTGGLFQIDATGKVTVQTATFDREATPAYTLTIEVADQATTTKLTSTVTLQVDISDINDMTPVFSSDPYNFNVAEDKAIGFTVQRVTATDDDTGSNAALTYSLTSSTPSAGKFRVDPSTGDVTVAAALDFETEPAYVLVVTATDQGTTPRSVTTTVSVAVSDVDDRPPVCAQSVYTVALAEDAAPAAVMTVSCPDGDTASVTYTMTHALFAVDPTTGVVTLSGALDYETAQSHTLTITASDGTRTDVTTVQVTVTDVNEHTPVFEATTPYLVSLSEDSSIGTTVKDVNAADADLGSTTLIFTITGGNADGKFSINSVTGVIVLQGSLDRETLDTYTLTLEVSDGTGAGFLTATTSTIVTVSDVNDNAPICNPSAYGENIAEDATTGAAVVTLTCSDVDTTTPAVRYTLLAAGNTGTAFAIDADSGALTVTGPGILDYETLTSYTLTVEVDDKATPARTTTVPVTVTVTPVNEKAPAFPGAGYGNTDVIESTAVGADVITVVASDDDTGLQHGTVRYSIVLGNAAGDFLIDSSTGKITVAHILNREDTPSYTLTVRAADDVAGSANEKTADVSVGITITDANDNYPVFTPAAYSTTIQETAAPAGTVITITVSDDDTGPNAALTVTIKSGNTGGAFSMTGNDLVLDTALDYETTQFYDLVIEAVDGGTPPLTSQARISIVVEAVNEEAPILTDDTFSANLAEDTALGFLVYTAIASDGDQGGNNDGSITYSITGGDTTPNSFIIDPNTGQLRVFSRLDFDTPPQTYNLIVQASDGGGKTDTVTLTLTLTDVNDHTPQFSANTYNTNLDENVNNGHAVFTIAATDNDSGVNGDVLYSIVGGNGQGSFAVGSTNGEITTTAAIDYETTSILYLVLRAADGGTASLSATVLLRIAVVDLNDNPPVLVPDNYAVTLSEDVAITTQVTTIGATDADSAASNNNVIVFSTTSAEFTVHASTGVVTTKALLDREANPTGYILEVVATDQGPLPQKNAATATVTVALTDVNDNDPVITGTYDVTKAEDIAVGTVVFQIIATDADAGDNGRLTYSITAGNTDTDLNIIATNGMVQVAQALDRERTGVYTLTIEVSDNGSPAVRQATTTATLTISDINDNDPVFTGTPYLFQVAENSLVNVVAGTVAATDADTGNNANLVYTLQIFWAGDNSHFTVDAATGQVKTAVSTLDRETRDTYSVLCRVHDQGTPQRFADANITINITDVNDNPPVFTATAYTGSVQENAVVDASVLTVVATDVDIGANAAITYTLHTSTAAGTKADTFLKVDPTTGEISVKANIDYETDKTFTFEVKATDGGSPALTDTATVTVNVTDVNDNAPTFVSTFINTEVAYGGQCNTTVAQPVCTDVDSGVNAQVTCYLVASTYDYLFNVDGATCSMTTQALANANTRYTVDVQCRDSGQPSNMVAATPATVRVDTFIPDNIVVVFQLSISRADFVAQQATFIANIAALIKVTYPSAIVRLWCIQEREGTASAPGATGRRRLLQSAQPVDVMMYTVKDDSTDSSGNVDKTKEFLTADQSMAFFAADATGTPSSSVTGGAMNYFGVQKVRTYSEDNKSFLETTEGIVVLAVAGVLGLVFLVLLIVVCVYCCRKRKRPVTPVRVVLVEKAEDGLPAAPRPLPLPQKAKDGASKPAWIKRNSGVPDLDKVNRASTSRSGLPTDAIAATAYKAYTQKKLDQERERQLDSRRKEVAATPTNILLTAHDDETVYPVTNREFDGRALDPTTNHVYEYNTRTHERRWLDSPPGYNV